MQCFAEPNANVCLVKGCFGFPSILPHHLPFALPQCYTHPFLPYLMFGRWARDVSHGNFHILHWSLMLVNFSSFSEKRFIFVSRVAWLEKYVFLKLLNYCLLVKKYLNLRSEISGCDTRAELFLWIHSHQSLSVSNANNVVQYGTETVFGGNRVQEILSSYLRLCFLLILKEWAWSANGYISWVGAIWNIYKNPSSFLNCMSFCLKTHLLPTGDYLSTFYEKFYINV